MRKSVIATVAVLGMAAFAAPALACGAHETAQSKPVDQVAQTKLPTGTKTTPTGG